MGKSITKGWYYNSTTGKYSYGVYNSSSEVRDVFNEDGELFQAGTKVTATAAELNALDASANGAATMYVKQAIPIVAAATAQDTEIVIPAGSIIKNVWLDVATAEATGTTKTVDIGVSGGDEDGFLSGVSVAATGTVKGTLLNTGQTLGALLAVDEDGAGALVPEPHVCSAATTLCYTLGSGDFADLVANLIVEYVLIP